MSIVDTTNIVGFQVKELTVFCGDYCSVSEERERESELLHRKEIGLFRHVF